MLFAISSPTTAAARPFSRSRPDPCRARGARSRSPRTHRRARAQCNVRAYRPVGSDHAAALSLTIGGMRLLRLAKIGHVSLKYGLDEFLTGHERFRAVRPLARALTFWRDTSAPRAVRLRLALEDLGPLFVKFGQMLSTRRDLLPADIADELAKLQDRVPPFPSEQRGRDPRSRLRQAGRSGVQGIRPHAGGERVGGASAFRRRCTTARRSRSRCCGPTSPR